MGEFGVGRLVSHPRLPLVAGIDEERAAARVWSWGSGEIREVGAVELGGEQDRERWDRWVPAVAWHPVDGLLVLAGADGLVQWREGFKPLPGATGAYHWLAFSPDGAAVWASPSSVGGEDAWEKSDALDLATGTLTTGLLGWDSDVVEHPAGGLVATLNSDQGATLVLFAQVVQNRLRVLRRGLILDADGYEAPMFSADGRYFAIRGNAYEHFVQVFEFPSLQRVLVVPLSDDDDSYDSWSFHNLAFVADTLLVGTPQGALVQFRVDQEQFAVHEVGEAITALAVGADGTVLVATAGGLRMLDPAPFESMLDRQPADPELVTAFIERTSVLDDLSNLHEDLDLTDGTRDFGPDELEKAEPDSADPTWLQIRRHLNALSQDEPS